MKYFEFGKENEKLMVLLHGGGVCYLGAEPAAKVLAKDFHVVLVAYDGFTPQNRIRSLYLLWMKPSDWAIIL